MYFNTAYEHTIQTLHHNYLVERTVYFGLLETKMDYYFAKMTRSLVNENVVILNLVRRLMPFFEENYLHVDHYFLAMYFF